jgi:hypothetical protein
MEHPDGRHSRPERDALGFVDLMDRIDIWEIEEIEGPHIVLCSLPNGAAITLGPFPNGMTAAAYVDEERLNDESDGTDLCPVRYRVIPFYPA